MQRKLKMDPTETRLLVLSNELRKQKFSTSFTQHPNFLGEFSISLNLLSSVVQIFEQLDNLVNKKLQGCIANVYFSNSSAGLKTSKKIGTTAKTAARQETRGVSSHLHVF